MSEHDSFDLNNLRVPLGSRVGALSRVDGLISEMSHPNIDWKFVINGIRAYLFDYIYEIIPHHEIILPILYHYIREATVRRKASALRAGDTFFDRYLFVLKQALAEGDGFISLKDFFDRHVTDYLDLLMALSGEGFYFGGVNDRVIALGKIMAAEAGGADARLDRINAFLQKQHSLYLSHAIHTTPAEIESIREIVGESVPTAELFALLRSVSGESAAKTIEEMAPREGETSAGRFARISDLADFSYYSRAWERICLLGKSHIQEGIIGDDNAIVFMLSFLIRKSQQGGNPDLQLFMSRTVASVVGILGKIHKGDLLKIVVDMVTPPLLAEVERGGNYYSAFAAIYSIGKAVIESGRITVIDHYVDMLVNSKFRFPEFTGIASDWSVVVNASHIENIRTWMRLIEINPNVTKKLAAALIVNLKLGGVFLKDTDVFQRDISRLLNSNYRDVFYLVISLAAVFPAFYHDIGATGNIRAFTEKIDTNHQMNDLIHFLRKQVHVESSSRTVLLIQRVMDFWMTGERGALKNMVPAEVFENLERNYRLMNLHAEKAAQAMYVKAKQRFPEHEGLLFWDFLNAVGKKNFMEFAGSAAFDEFPPAERADTLAGIEEYYETQFPAEMTKMLHHIRSMFDIDTSRTQMWKFMYEISDEDFRGIFEDKRLLDVSKVNIERFILFLHVYRMIYDKYNFSEVRDIEKLDQYARENLFEPPAGFFEKLKGRDTRAALESVLDLQQKLKRDILLSETEYEPIDTIEFKRHIAFGIPSMYGSYKERKFDTLKVFFHCNLVRERLFETIVEGSAIFPHDRIDYDEIRQVLKLFHGTFEIDGLANHELRSVISLLDLPNLLISQLRDIITSLLAIHGEISDRFNETYKYVCRVIIGNIGLERIVEDYLPHERNESVEVIADRFLRDQIMQSPLLQLVDNLLIRLKERIAHELSVRGDVVCLNGSDLRLAKGRIYFDIRKYPGVHSEHELFVPLWLAGSKAQGLVIAANLDGVNVPEGLVISSELYKRLREGDTYNPRFQRKILYSLRKYIDHFTGGRFGNPRDPVLLSVRSGAVFSMPGVMDTITNVGLTQEIVDRLAERDEWFAYDCYRRLIHDFGISNYGMDRSLFERLMAVAKEEAEVALKEKLSGMQMEVLTKKYRFAINRAGFSVPKDPYEQLFYAIVAVFRSWDSPVARDYRTFVGISDAWGTAVIIQRMVFGNNSPSSITGVVHSHYLGYENIGLFGEYKTRAQGHDIVSGVARVFPISEEQRANYSMAAHFPSLEKSYPAHYRQVYEAVGRIRDRWGNEVEIEFTFEDDMLYILQIRGMANHIFEIEEMAESTDELKNHLLGQGLAASGGAVSGRVVFDIARIGLMREKYPGEKIILAMPETNPEDVIGIKDSDGILTCVGGMTSHAVLQMRRLEKSGVSDFSAMKIDEANNMAIVNREPQGTGKVVIRESDFLTIDGRTGHVYLGFHPTGRKAH
ncbi:MAG: hypothetical protein EPN93_04955 [Spirochaetes bacterium]|nr:MAG: hypothetical protein EPN93_04955 [Spirochaetota bacterium]